MTNRTCAYVASISELRSALSARRPRSIALVPTMGALHAGHRRLIEAARRECETVVVTIFVNPLQFDRAEDLKRYPRTFDADLDVCAEAGVDIVFAPSDLEIYPSAPACTVDVGHLADHLCGKYRPGHFRGVATVVLKLFNSVQPTHAYFGEKDAQQLAIIRRMVADFNLPVTIVEIPTVRDADGLALSSRNQRLTAEERVVAPSLYRALCRAREEIAGGETDPAAVTKRARQEIPAAIRVEYLEIVDPAEMQPVETIGGPVRIAAAVWIGSTRLIDNVLCKT